jgi:hypothetical protein
MQGVGWLKAILVERVVVGAHIAVLAMCATASVNGQNRGAFELVESEAGPRPLIGRRHEAPRERIAVHIIQLLQPLSLDPEVHVVEASLPDPVGMQVVQTVKVALSGHAGTIMPEGRTHGKLRHVCATRVIPCFFSKLFLIDS